MCYIFFSHVTSNFLILKNCREMESFNIISYFSVALDAEFHVIHI